MSKEYFMKIRNRVLEANLMFVLVSILFITIGGYVQSLSVKGGILITEYVILLVPMFTYLVVVRRARLKEYLRVNSLSLLQIIIIIVATISFMPVALFANSLMIFLMNTLGIQVMVPPIPTASNSSEYVVLLFIIAVSAGVCEELFFRGFMLRAFGSQGRKKAIVLAAILFALLHFNMANLLSPLALGCMFGYMVYVTNSIFASVIAHTVHNGMIVTYLYIMTSRFGDIMEKAREMNATDAINASQIAALLIMALIFGGIAVLLLKTLEKVTSKRVLDLTEEAHPQIHKVSILSYAPLLLPILGFLYLNLR